VGGKRGLTGLWPLIPSWERSHPWERTRPRGVHPVPGSPPVPGSAAVPAAPANFDNPWERTRPGCPPTISDARTPNASSSARKRTPILFMDIRDSVVQVGFVADIPIPVLNLPEGAGAPQHAIHCMGGIGLPGVKHLREGVPRAAVQ